ncbi:hypothetical protein RRG08_054157 [Elysia crispata]|uniref:Uncharacterized protein n=1 Tax=Elysia crispata TaxID=231223 RepID=A0AAE1A244_9GAST|nr:hypothetical protein RRG08_054157 [Elysia crispata]
MTMTNTRLIFDQNRSHTKALAEGREGLWRWEQYDIKMTSRKLKFHCKSPICSRLETEPRLRKETGKSAVQATIKIENKVRNDNLARVQIL